MADDEYLLRLLERALASEPVDPPDDRVASVRALASPGRHLVAVGPTSPTSAAPVPGPPAPPGDLRRQHRVGWLAAAVTVAAAALVVGLIALPGLLGDGARHRTSSVAATRSAAARLRIALASQDPVAVAKADRELIRQAQAQGPGAGDREVPGAVAAHSDALAFLRDHPDPAALSEIGPPAAAGSLTTPAPVVPPAGASPSTITVPSSVESAVPTSVADTVPVPVDGRARTVTILGVTARLDGTFAVDFTTAGFTPDGSAKPGTFSVRFSFDDGQAPTTWAGASPWTFPQNQAITYHQVCARVIDAAGVEDPSSGGCHSIL